MKLFGAVSPRRRCAARLVACLAVSLCVRPHTTACQPDWPKLSRSKGTPAFVHELSVGRLAAILASGEMVRLFLFAGLIASAAASQLYYTVEVAASDPSLVYQDDWQPLSPLGGGEPKYRSSVVINASVALHIPEGGTRRLPSRFLNLITPVQLLPSSSPTRPAKEVQTSAPASISAKSRSPSIPLSLDRRVRMSRATCCASIRRALRPYCRRQCRMNASGA